MPMQLLTVWKNDNFTLTCNVFWEDSLQHNLEIGRCVDFTDFLRRNGENKFLQFPHCASWGLKAS